jgi:hypothetical protein
MSGMREHSQTERLFASPHLEPLAVAPKHKISNRENPMNKDQLFVELRQQDNAVRRPNSQRASDVLPTLARDLTKRVREHQIKFLRTAPFTKTLRGTQMGWLPGPEPLPKNDAKEELVRKLMENVQKENPSSEPDIEKSQEKIRDIGKSA